MELPLIAPTQKIKSSDGNHNFFFFIKYGQPFSRWKRRAARTVFYPRFFTSEKKENVFEKSIAGPR
jgi:hypothetical protein